MVDEAVRKLCVCGRSAAYPICDGSHDEEGWRCDAARPWVRHLFWAPPSYINLAAKLAAHTGGLVWRPGMTTAAERLVALVDAASLPAWRATGPLVDAQEVWGVPLGELPARLLSVPGRPVSLLWAPGDADPRAYFAPILRALDGPEPVGVQREPALCSGFLSHAVRDEGLIEPVVSLARESLGVRLFLCADSIPHDARWSEAIEAALREHDRFVFLLSEASARSHYCSFEIGVATGLGRTIRVINLDGTPPPAFIQHLNMIDLQRDARRRPWLSSRELLLDALILALS